MRFKFYHTLDKDLESDFLKLAERGIPAIGCKLAVGHVNEFGGKPEADIAVMWGVSAESRALVDAYREKGRRTLIFDKGAIRQRNKSDFNKVFLDGGTALAYLHRVRRPSDRWERLGITLKPWRKRGSHIIYANNSQKVHDYWHLGASDDVTADVIAKLRRIAPKREIVFRPKPLALDFQEVEGVRLSLRPETIEEALEGAQCLVTYTSHCSVNALMEGVPAVCLNLNPARALAGAYLEQVLDPPMPGEAKRHQFFCDLAYAQWSDAEIANGAAWRFLLGEIAETYAAPHEPRKPNVRERR